MVDVGGVVVDSRLVDYIDGVADCDAVVSVVIVGVGSVDVAVCFDAMGYCVVAWLILPLSWLPMIWCDVLY